MSGRRWLVGGLAAVAVGAGAWWLLDAGGSRPATDETRAREAEARREQPELGEASLTGRAEGEAGRTAAGPRTLRSGSAAIVGTVTRGGPPSAAEVRVAFLFSTEGATLLGPKGASFFDRLLDASPYRGSPSATATAGPDGRFAIEGIAAGAYRVTAVASDGARASTRAVILVEGSRVEADIALPVGAETLRGRVVDVAGAPWTGWVFLERADPQGRIDMFAVRGEPVSLDAEGRFQAIGLDPGSYVLTAMLDGAFRTGSRPVTVPRADELVFVVETGSDDVAGRVVADDDGTPVAGASVLGAGQSGGPLGTIARTTTDDDGRFRMKMTAGRLGWAVRARGFAPAVLQRTEKSAEEVEIRLVRAARLAGRVTQEGAGTPLAGLAVAVVSLERDGLGFLATPASAVTDADGRYALDDLAPGEAMAYARGGGWVSRGLGQVKNDGFNPLALRLEAGRTTTADLVVVRGVRAAGTVTDAAGAPVAGAVVEASLSGIRNELGALAGDMAAATSADGTYAVHGLPAGGEARFRATAPGQPEVRAGPFVVEGEALRVDLRFGAVRHVLVRVVERGSGAPVAGATLRASSGEARWVTGADGTARVGPVATGALTLRVEAEGFWVGEGRVQVPEGAAETVVELERGASVAGRVRFDDDAPGAGAEIRAEPKKGGSGWSPNARGVARADGTFRLAGLAPGGQRLHASLVRGGKPYSGSADVEDGDDEVVLTLAPEEKGPTGKLTVRVVGPDGRRVPRALARLRSESSTYGTNVLDGVVVFDGPFPRGAWVEVWQARGANGEPLPHGPARAEGLPAEGGEIEIRLPPELAIEGRVVGPDGKGVRGILVHAHSGSESEVRDALASDRSGDDGRFRLGSLGSDSYRIVVEHPSEFAPFEPVSVAAGSRDVVLALASGAVAQVTVLDWRGEPVAGVAVSVQRTPSADDRSSPRPVASATTDPSGVARLVGLDANARYRLGVAVPAGRLDLRPPSLGDWIPGDAVLRFARAYVVRGVVRDRSGRPAEGVTVWRQHAERGWSGTGTADDGTFLLRDLDAGTLVLLATAPGQSPSDELERVTVEAGNENVVLVVDPGVTLSGVVENWGEHPGRGDALVMPEDGSFGTQRFATLDREGSFRFPGLRADVTYALWIPPAAEGWSCYRAGLRARSDLRVRLAQGKSIRGTVRVPAGSTHVQVSAGDSRVVSVNAEAAPDGTYRLAGLPDGTYTVWVHAQTADGKWVGKSVTDVPAGGTADVDLREP